MLIHSALPAAAAQHRGDLARAVLREIASHLERLAADPAYSDAIDLRSLPLQEADRAVLKRRLGEGEVRATLDVAGETRVTETAFAGVWWLVHLGADGETVAEQLAVARAPDILLAQPDDIALASARLIAEIDIDEPDPLHPTAKETAHD